MAFRSSTLTQIPNGSGDVLTGALPAGTAAGDRLLAFITQDVAGHTITAATGWDATPLASLDNSGPDGQSARVFEKKNATGSDAVNFTSSDTRRATVIIVAFSGRDNSASATVSTPTVNTSTNSSPISVSLTGLTAATGDDLAWFAQLDQVAQTDTWGFSSPSGFTERQDASNGDWITATANTKDNSASGATGSLSATATRVSGTAGAGWSGVVIALPSASGSSTNLTIQDMAHGVAIDNIALTSQMGLAIADMAHSVTVDNIVLTSQLALTVADMVHGVTIDNLTLAAIDSTSLVVADMLHAVAIDAPVLTTTTVLAIADLAHALAIDNLALTLDTSLVIAELAHTLAIDNLTLSTAASTNLTVADLLHAVAIDNIALTSQLALVVADMAHALAIDNLVLTSATTLAIAELAHTVAIDNLTLTALTGTNLLIDDTTHAVSIDNVVLTSATALVIADMVHALAFDNVTLTSATALVIADMLHGVSIDNLTLAIPGGGYSTLDLIFKILTNRQELSPTAGTFTLYDDDSTTVLYTAAAWADTAGTVPYSGGKLQRIDALQ